VDLRDLWPNALGADCRRLALPRAGAGQVTGRVIAAGRLGGRAILRPRGTTLLQQACDRLPHRRIIVDYKYE
jgi:hypothetical protein